MLVTYVFTVLDKSYLKTKTANNNLVVITLLSNSIINTIKVFQKSLFILVFLLNCNILFPQNNNGFNKPWGVKAYYCKQYEKDLDANYPCVSLEASYFFFESFNAGVFVNGGTYKYEMTFYEDNNTILYDGECRDLFWKYGFCSEFHPIPLLFPNFNIIDVFLEGCIGAYTFTSDYWPTKHKFLFGLGIGIAVNISKHFGLFYERGYDNVNKAYQGETEKHKAMNRFGLNIRFGGPKKWQR